MLSEYELAKYKRVGYLYPRSAVSAANAADMKIALDAYIDRFGPAARGKGMMTKRPHIVLRWVAELAR